MGKNSRIEWCDHTWNPWYGCRKVSQGCKNCYMFRDMQRTRFNPHIITRAKPATFNKPLEWQPPARIFTCSWSDFWIEEADSWRKDAMSIIFGTPRHKYLILTKRPERIIPWMKQTNMPGNIWLGVSVENQKQAELRIPLLLQIDATVKFLSCEPLLESLNLREWLPELDWVITGGESGPFSRPAALDWFREIRDQCTDNGVAYFHKQHGGNQKIQGAWGGRMLDLKYWDEFPFYI